MPAEVAALQALYETCLSCSKILRVVRLPVQLCLRLLVFGAMWKHIRSVATLNLLDGGSTPAENSKTEFAVPLRIGRRRHLAHSSLAYAGNTGSAVIDLLATP